jgi:quinol monooxygenase YgiN
MAVTSCVFYEAKPGRAAAVQEIMSALRAHTVQEPGCLAYEPHCDPEDDTRFFLFECYVDAAALSEHQASQYFQSYVREQLPEHLVDRQVYRFQPLAERPLTR